MAQSLHGNKTDSAPKPLAACLNHYHAQQGPQGEVGREESDQKDAGIDVGLERNHQKRRQSQEQARLAQKAKQQHAQLDANRHAVGLACPSEQKPEDSEPLRQAQVVVKVGGILGLKVAKAKGHAQPKQGGSKGSVGNAKSKFALAGSLGTVFHSFGGR